MKSKLLLVLTLVMYSTSSLACSKITKTINNEVFTARTVDLCADLPYDIAVYPRGLKESGEVTGNKTINWTSKYASIVAREILTNVNANIDGVNEKGLAVNLLYLDGTQYEKRDPNKAGISIYKWAKYALDNYTTVNEVLNSLPNYQIVIEPIKIGQKTTIFPLHFSISDSTGDNAIIEFLNGKMVVFHDRNYNIMTNEPSYDKQLANLTKYRNDKKMYNLENLPGGANSKNRFVRASFYESNSPSRAANNQEAVNNMFSAISGTYTPYYEGYKEGCGLTGGPETDDVWPTQWVTVLDLHNHVLYLMNGIAGNYVKVSLDDYKTNTKIIVIDPKSAIKIQP